MPSTIELRQEDRVVGSVPDFATTIDASELTADGAFNDEALVARIRNACISNGFFYIGGLQSDDLSSWPILGKMQSFFSLDDQDPRKQSVLQGDNGYGWVPMYSEPAYQPDTVAHMESFDCGLNNFSGATSQRAWPDIPGFGNDVTNCWREFSALGSSALKLISAAAGFDPEFLPGNCDSRKLDTLRLLHYPANNIPACDRNVGIAAHTDFECITLIYQSAPGLELMGPSDQWLDAPSHDGRIVVLLDDMLERWTNGIFKATGHRVRNTAEQRFSIVLFFAANDGINISPAPPLVSKTRPARFAPITQARHIDDEVQRAEHNAKAAARNHDPR